RVASRRAGTRGHRRVAAAGSRDRRMAGARRERWERVARVQALLFTAHPARGARRRRRDLRRLLVRRRARVTGRKRSYRSIASLQRDNRACRACTEAGYRLESLPVVAPYPGQRAYRPGQAPGAVEGAERRRWRGRAGRTLRRWLALDEDAFYRTFYCAAVTRCYPGKARSGRGDRTPASTEREL